MRPLRLLPALLLLALAAAPLPARAGTAELRLALARLIETLDAGLGRGDLRALRIEINAEIRVQRQLGENAMAELGETSRMLTAADQVWAVLLGSPACQAASAGAPLSDAAACRTQLTPPLEALGLTAPDLTAQTNLQAVLQPALQALRRQAERTMRNLR